ncbi:MAG: GNAT family N-acetyltransferase [Bacteroidota bacterium]|nr:GNAT family N-acetyltransferase [Bacteroidota bacterium]
MPEIVIPTRNDLPKLAQCHRTAFPRTLSAAMGQRYVEKMLEWYLVDDRAFIFFLQEGSSCVGYCGGLKFDGTHNVGSASSMIQHSYTLALRTFFRRPWLFLHPEFRPKYRLALKNVVRRIGKALGLMSTSRVTKQANPREAHTGLIVIGVNPDLQGKGYGSQLLQEFERSSLALGYNKMMLTVRTDNSKAIQSYVRNGWQTTKVEGKSTTMEKRLS